MFRCVLQHSVPAQCCLSRCVLPHWPGGWILHTSRGEQARQQQTEDRQLVHSSFQKFSILHHWLDQASDIEGNVRSNWSVLLKQFLSFGFGGNPRSVLSVVIIVSVASIPIVPSLIVPSVPSVPSVPPLADEPRGAAGGVRHWPRHWGAGGSTADTLLNYTNMFIYQARESSLVPAWVLTPQFLQET